MPAVDNPRRIGFVHCVGSRDEKVGNRYCSKVCCATAVKQACEIKQQFPDAVVYCFYMDLRMFGRGYEDMYLEAQKKYGVIFVRGRVSEVSEDKDGHLFVKAEDTLSGKPLRVTLDLLVLMAGMSHNRAVAYPRALHHGRRLPQAQGLPHGRPGVILHGSVLRRSMHRAQDPA